MPFTPAQKSAVNSCKKFLIEDMDVGISMDLYANNIFLNREYQLVKNEVTDQDKRAKILEILITKDSTVWNFWLQKLRDARQENLAKQLETELQNQIEF